MGSEFGVLDPATATRTTICPIPLALWLGCACDTDGTLYAVDAMGVLCTIDKSTGEATTIGTTGLYSSIFTTGQSYPTSAVIDPTAHVMYISAAPADGGGLLYSINLKDATATQICGYPNDEEIVGLAMPLGLSADMPNPAENFRVEYPKGGIGGKYYFTAPSRTASGAKGEGELSYTVYEDGIGEDYIVDDGTCQWGAEVSRGLVCFYTGAHEYTIIMTANGHDSYARKFNVWVGSDTPQAPVALLVREGNVNHITWTLPEGGVHGGYVNPQDVTYTVTRYPDNQVVASMIKDLGYDDTAEETQQIVDYSYGVTCFYQGETSAEGRTDAVRTGYLAAPFEQHFDTQADFDQYTVINNNDDHAVWKWMQEGENGVARVNFSGSNPQDDYLVTPRIYLEKGKAYDLSFAVNAERADKTERIEVLLSSGEPVVADFTTTLLPAIDVHKADQYHKMHAMIVPQNDGIYYIGFHGISDPNKYYLKLDDICLAAAQDAGVPSAVTDLTVTPDYNGTLSATLAFTAPSKAADGTALTAINAINIIRDGQFAGTIENPEPGKPTTFTDEKVPALGYHTYMVVAENNYGEGVPYMTVSYVGVNVPTEVTDLTIEESPEESGNVTLTWKAPAVDVDGNKLNPDLVTYTIADVSTGTPVILSSGVKELQWSKNVCDHEKQDMLAFAVAAVTDAGTAPGVATGMTVVGKPYDLTFEEHAPLEGLNHPMEMVWENPENKAQWSTWTYEDTGYDVKAPDGDLGFLGLQATTQGSECTLWTGKIKLPAEATDAKLDFMDFNWYNPETQVENKNLMQVKVRLADGTDEVAKDIYTTDYAEKNAWMPASIDMGIYAGKTIRVGFRGVCNSYALMYLDDIRLSSETCGLSVLPMGDGFSVKSLKGALNINIPQGLYFNVVSTTGAIMHSGLSTGTQTVELPAGLYIVRVNGRSIKAIAK